MFSTKKINRPPNLDLTPKNNSPTSSVSSSETPTSSSTQHCTTPELQKFFLDKDLGVIEASITYSTNSINNGQNGVVRRITFCAQGKTRELVRKRVKQQGNSALKHGMQREIMINKSIQSIKTDIPNFPFKFFALPIAQGSDGTIDILYTCYQEIGDLQTHAQYIYTQYNTNSSAVLNYLFQGFYQLLKAIDALEKFEFEDEEGKKHPGIIHNDIKPSNIFLKKNGDFILGDFGCAYFKNEAAPQISTFLFSAPEVFIDKTFCKKSSDKINTDVWSLGASLWYLLTNQLISPTLPNESLSDIEKILLYQEWAKKYSEQWQNLIKTHLNLTDDAFSEEIKNSLEMDLQNLRNSNGLENTKGKKKILKKLALWMLAPLSERPSVSELLVLMDRFKDYFIVYNDAASFALQLLERAKERNQAHPINQGDQKNNKPVFSR